MAEFSGVRAKLYKECMKEFPRARKEDFEVMKKYLAPKSNETILEIGAGSGFFSKEISDILKNGKLIVSDPSKEQLEEIKLLKRNNIEVIEVGAEYKNAFIKLKSKADAIWSFGAMHHCYDKSSAFRNFEYALKNNGRLVIADVWSGSKLAKHFDDKVAKFCITGHEAYFWSDEYAESLCYLNGFSRPEIYELNISWKFKTKEEIGTFLYKIHAMTKTTPEECLKGAEKILGVEKKNNIYCLNWPMKVMISRKV